MKIKHKLITGFLVIALLFSIVAIWSIIQLNKISRPLKEEFPSIIEQLYQSIEMDTIVHDIRYFGELQTQNVRNYVLTHDLKWKQRYYVFDPLVKKTINQSLEKSSKETKSIFKQINDSMIELTIFEKSAINYVDEKKYDSAIEFINNKSYWKKKSIFEKFLQNYFLKYGISEEHKNKVKLYAKQTKYQLQYTIWVVIVFSICIIFLSIIIGVLITRSISKPLQKLTHYTKLIGSENFDQKIEIKQKGEIGVLALSFDKMQKKLKIAIQNYINEKNNALEANKIKSQFLASMSHDIRTPMNAIIGFSNLALNTDLTNKQKNYIKTINKSANNLLGILNDVLDLSKVEAGKVDLEYIEFDLEQLLYNILSRFIIKTEAKGIELLFYIQNNISPTMYGDPLRLGQILNNLIINAIKYTESGEIIVKAELLEKELSNIEDKVCLKFSVQDTGIGMTEEQQSRLFKPFTQADASTTPKYGRSGLGLSICKNLVEIMDGSIQVESKPGEGSTFSFTVLIGMKKNRSKPSQIFEDEVTKMRVLVVDDNHASCLILAKLLQSFSFDVIQASSGKEAIQILGSVTKNEKPIKFVFMDWKMPQMDGIEVSLKIKNLNLFYDPTIIMVTAYNKDDIQQKAFDAGIKGFLLKPVYPSKLFNTIMKFLGMIDDKKDFIPLEESVKKHEKTTSIKGSKILLVEDDSINQQVATELLEYEGLIVKAVDNGLEAVEIMKKESFDAVLMDVQMPVMDGYIATKKIRQLDMKSCRTPIIAMTAHTFKGEREKCLQAGMNDYLSKPIDNIALFTLLKKWIKPKKTTSYDDKEDNINEKTDLKLDFSDKQSIKNIDFTSILDLTKKLSYLLETGDLEAEIILKKIFEILEGTKVADYLIKIKNYIDNYYFTEANQKLKEFIELIKDAEKWKNIAEK